MANSKENTVKSKVKAGKIAKTMTVPTAKKQKRGTGKPFQKGVSGNPTGRPKGSKNKLSEDFLTALCADFEQHGEKAIIAMRKNDPTGYIKVVAGLMPKDMNVNVTGAEAFVQAWKAISAGASPAAISN